MESAESMTETEAHEFIALWRRRMNPWRARMEAEAVWDMERSCLVMICTGLLMLVVGAASLSTSFFWLAAALFGASEFGFSLWLFLGLRQSRLVLGNSLIDNRKS